MRQRSEAEMIAISEKARIRVENDIKIKINDISEMVLNELKKYLIFENPEWIAKERMNRWNGNIPKYLKFIEHRNNDIIIPRGFIGQLTEILKRNYTQFEILNNSRILPEVKFQFSGELYDFQVRAVEAVLLKEFGVLNSPPGSGKTVMALKIIAERRQPALVVVHSKELFYQWRERAESFLDLGADEIGLIGDNKFRIGSRLTIAIVNTLSQKLNLVKDQIGFLVVDECHRIPAKTFMEVVKYFDCRFLLGLSATPYRADGLTEVIHFFLGETTYKIDTTELRAEKRIMSAELITRVTDFDFNYRDDYGKMIDALVKNVNRNTLIMRDVVTQKNEPGMILILTDRIEHAQYFYNELVKSGIEARLLTGEIGTKQRKQIVLELNGGGVKVLVATSQLIGEGFDLRALSAIFLTTPIKFSGRLKQYIGRILRMAPGKERALIYDYQDKPSVLKASYWSRLKAYKDYGIDVEWTIRNFIRNT